MSITKAIPMLAVLYSTDESKKVANRQPILIGYVLLNNALHKPATYAIFHEDETNEMPVALSSFQLEGDDGNQLASKIKYYELDENNDVVLDDETRQPKVFTEDIMKFLPEITNCWLETNGNGLYHKAVPYVKRDDIPLAQHRANQVVNLARL